MAPERILITGAAGRIGTMLRPRLARRGRVLRLLDVEPVTRPGDAEEVVAASVTDLHAMEEACRDVEAVVHLGGIAAEAPWERIADVNIHGTYTAFEAARRQGVGRLVFASSNHAVGFYPRSAAPAPDYAFPAPDTFYGVSKVTGEALGALYHHRYGMQVVCLRILSCRDRPGTPRELATWLSADDMGRLAEAALSAPAPGFRVVWGVSANTRGWFSLDEGRHIGYQPEDDAEAFAAEILGAHGEPDADGPEHRTVGGPFCSERYDIDNL